MASQAAVSQNAVIENQHNIKFITLKFTSDQTTTGDSTSFDVNGTVYGQEGLRLHSVTVTGGVTADSEVGPTANLELHITDSSNSNILVNQAGNGANIVDGDDSSNFALAEDTTHVIHGPLTVNVDSGDGNLVDNANGAITRVKMGFVPIVCP
jgi:hypothetical protein